MRPGCGSLSVDPDLVDALRVRFEGGRLHSRRVELAELEDEFEAMFARGWTDGLPVVPPTEERVLRMLEGTTRDAQDIVATVPPDLVDVTVEKVAIAAVMAGCLPEYLPWVLTGDRGDLQRRVQHPRRAGHDDAGRAGDHLQRAGHAQPSA